MTTTLKKFNDAYATMTVAAYEPLILRWISGFTLCNCASAMAWRLQKSKHIKLDGAFTTARALMVRKSILPPTEYLRETKSVTREMDRYTKLETPPKSVAVDGSGQPFSDGVVRKIELKGFPNAVAVGDTVYPRGVLKVHPVRQSSQGDPFKGAKTLPVFTSGVAGSVEKEFNYAKAEEEIFNSMRTY